MRGLVMVAVVVLLVGCGSSDEDSSGDTSPVRTTVVATPPVATAQTAKAISASTALTASPTIPAATPTHGLTPSPTMTETLPTPIVVGSPAADLPIAGQIATTVAVGRNPFAVAAGHGAIWVQNDIDGTLSRIDPATNAVVATIQIASPIDPSSPPSELLGLRQARPALAIDADFVWATKPEEQAVVQVDPATNTVVATIPMGAKVTSLATDGSSLWVSLFGTSSIVRVDTSTHEVIATVSNVPTPAGIAVHQDAVWVANYLSDTVTRIDQQTNQVVAQISVRWPGAPFTGFQCSLCTTEVLANDDGVWVTLLTAGVIARIDTATNRLAAIIPVGVQPNSLASDTHGVWVGHKSTAGVLQIDPRTNQVVAAVPATEAPHQLPAIAIWENIIWVAVVPTHSLVRIE